MSSQNIQTSCKQRFKGVENFLRRVAFNLGNTPSQTDVKIISCIPIDVTDLQKKIMNLEKQLYEAKEQDHDRKTNPKPPEEPKNNTEKPSAVVNTALYNTPLAKQSSTVCYCSRTTHNRRQQPASIHRGECSLRPNKSNVSFAFPALSTAEATQTAKVDSNVSSNNIDQNVYHAAFKRYKNIFYNRKRKKDKAKRKLKTQLVYYAQTSNNPFNMHLNTRRYLNSTEAMCLSHLNNVVQKQYDPNYDVEEFTDTSNFTKPICRDISEGFKQPFQYESDVCSCCHGKFQNIDNYMTTSRHYDSYIFPREKEASENTNIYYNSKDYDIIPVKENLNQTLNENLNKTETKIDIDIKCWPEKYRTKYRFHPFVVNYQTELSTNRRSPQRIYQKLLEIEKPKRSSRSARCNTLYQHAMDSTSKSCSIECSNVYKKQPFQNIKVRKPDPIKVIQNDVLIATDDAHQVQINTQSTDLNTAYNIKTESTLDEIKTMLQNVLAEVKTSAKLNNCIEEKVRKDAIVQKGPSQNNMPGASTLLHSFTYNNSCNVIPYLPTCSRQMPQPYCFASVPCQPVKLENFPVFVHPSPRKHICAYYHKNNSFKQTTAATNTDKDFQESSSKETENLIKEIYKSIALNLDSTTKENSLSEYDDLKSADGFTNTSCKEIKTTGIVKNKRDVEIDAIMTPLESNSNDSKVVYTAYTQSDAMSRNSEPCYSAVNRNTGQAKNVYRLEQENNIIHEDEETDQYDETESGETEIIDQYEHDKKEKKGFLQRMYKSVKLFRKKKDNQPQPQRVEESDSDDYETIYSHQLAAPTNIRRRRNNRRNYSKVHCLYENRRERERPYLEQEYRRQWNEGLTFHYSPNKINADKHFPKQNSKQNPYWKNYEARSVIVDNVPNIKTMSLDKYGDEAIQRDTKPKDKLGWFKKHKLGIKCGEQWKNFILEN